MISYTMHLNTLKNKVNMTSLLANIKNYVILNISKQVTDDKLTCIFFYL